MSSEVISENIYENVPQGVRDLLSPGAPGLSEAEVMALRFWYLCHVKFVLPNWAPAEFGRLFGPAGPRLMSRIRRGEFEHRTAEVEAYGPGPRARAARSGDQGGTGHAA